MRASEYSRCIGKAVVRWTYEGVISPAPTGPESNRRVDRVHLESRFQILFVLAWRFQGFTSGFFGALSSARGRLRNVDSNWLVSGV
jgi:hypothetical protein